MTPYWLSYALHVAGQTFAIVGISEGVRRIGAHGLSKNDVCVRAETARNGQKRTVGFCAKAAIHIYGMS